MEYECESFGTNKVASFNFMLTPIFGVKETAGGDDCRLVVGFACGFWCVCVQWFRCERSNGNAENMIYPHLHRARILLLPLPSSRLSFRPIFLFPIFCLAHIIGILSLIVTIWLNPFCIHTSAFAALKTESNRTEKPFDYWFYIHLVNLDKYQFRKSAYFNTQTNSYTMA